MLDTTSPPLLQSKLSPFLQSQSHGIILWTDWLYFPNVTRKHCILNCGLQKETTCYAVGHLLVILGSNCGQYPQVSLMSIRWTSHISLLTVLRSTSLESSGIANVLFMYDTFNLWLIDERSPPWMSIKKLMCLPSSFPGRNQSPINRILKFKLLYHYLIINFFGQWNIRFFQVIHEVKWVRNLQWMKSFFHQLHLL